jgi:hypothetical protein
MLNLFTTLKRGASIGKADVPIDSFSEESPFMGRDKSRSFAPLRMTNNALRMTKRISREADRRS